MTIIELIELAVVVISIVVSIVVSIFEKKSNTAKYQNAIAFLERVKELMCVVEKHKNWTGEEREMFVISMLTPLMDKLGITEEQVKLLIKENILFSKSVNYKGGE